MQNKKFTLEIDMNSLAFEDGENGLCELHNILEQIARGIGSKNLGGNFITGDPGQWGVIHTASSGGMVGQWHFKRIRKS